MKTTEHRRLVDAGAVAELFGVTRQTVHGWRRAGRIPYVQVSRNVIRFDLEAVEQALRSDRDDREQRP